MLIANRHKLSRMDPRSQTIKITYKGAGHGTFFSKHKLMFHDCTIVSSYNMLYNSSHKKQNFRRVGESKISLTVSFSSSPQWYTFLIGNTIIKFLIARKYPTPLVVRVCTCWCSHRGPKRRSPMRGRIAYYVF